MKCPDCSGKTGVIESRDVQGRYRRRRACNECRWRFTTYEVTKGELEKLLHAERVLSKVEKLIDN